MHFLLLMLTLFFVVLLNLPRLSVPRLLLVLFYIWSFCRLYQKCKGLNSETLWPSDYCSRLLFVFVYPIVKLIPFVKNESSKMQSYLPKAEIYIKKYYFEAKNFILNKYNYEIDDKILIDGIVVMKDVSQEFLLSLPSYLGSFLEWIFLVPIFLFFLLQDGRKFKRLVLKKWCQTPSLNGCISCLRSLIRKLRLYICESC